MLPVLLDEAESACLPMRSVASAAGIAGAAQAALSPGTAANAVFLHTGWRSGGTWIWGRCRSHPSVCGFYEPLHEQAATFRRSDLARLGPASWRSSHSATAPYFGEYAALLNPSGRGVTAYHERFAYDGFFLEETAPPDPAIEHYLQGLLAHAATSGRQPVLKFCRSLGRIGWFMRRFPEAAHFAVLRGPVAQFRSVERMLMQRRNRYFTTMPVLTLARNLNAPRVRDLVLRFGLRLPALHSADLTYQIETCWWQVRAMDEAERYRSFLAFWTLAALHALESPATLIDMDRLGTDVKYRAGVQDALSQATAASISLEGWRSPIGNDHTMVAGHADAHAAALELVASREHRLTPERFDWLQSKLHVSGATVSMTPAIRLPLPLALSRPGLRNGLQRTATALLVLTSHAIQPLRRLHGALVWR